MFLRLFFLLALPLTLLAQGAAPAARTDPPANFFDTYNKLSVIVDDEDPDPMDMARGGLLATQFFSVGPAGLPKAQSWFSTAPTRGRASMSGLFLAIHGRPEHLSFVQRALETDRQKRSWIYEMVGTANNFNLSMENGEMWQPFLRVLPKTDGCRTLAANCMKSRDPLVRRTGLYWGYWFATSNYWTQARAVAARDPDPLARQMATYLLRTGRQTPAK